MDDGEIFVTELEVEMQRYVLLTKNWSGHHRYRVMANWMGMLRMREMNDFLQAQMAEAKLHSDRASEGPEEDDNGV